MRKLTKNQFEEIKEYIEMISRTLPPITLAIAS